MRKNYYSKKMAGKKRDLEKNILRDLRTDDFVKKYETLKRTDIKIDVQHFQIGEGYFYFNEYPSLSKENLLGTSVSKDNDEDIYNIVYDITEVIIKFIYGNKFRTLTFNLHYDSYVSEEYIKNNIIYLLKSNHLYDEYITHNFLKGNYRLKEKFRKRFTKSELISLQKRSNHFGKTYISNNPRRKVKECLYNMKKSYNNILKEVPIHYYLTIEKGSESLVNEFGDLEIYPYDEFMNEEPKTNGREDFTIYDWVY